MLYKEINWGRSKRVLNDIAIEMYSKRFDEISLSEKDAVTDEAVAREAVVFTERVIPDTTTYKYRDMDIVYNALGNGGHGVWTVFDGEEDIEFDTYYEARDLVDDMYFDSYGYYHRKHNIPFV